MTDKSPDAYRTISEAAEESGLPAHVLRFWESKFSQLKPLKRKGGRRLYRPQDIALLKGLRRLLYEEGLTIKGAQKYLKDHGVGAVAALGEGNGAMRAGEGGSTGESTSIAATGGSTAEPDAVRRALARVEAARTRLSQALGD